MITITRCYGLSDAQYTRLKADVKAAFGSRASVRIHRQVRTYGFVDIRPVKRPGETFAQFSDAEAASVMQFCKARGLAMTMHWEAQDAWLHRYGFDYMYMTQPEAAA